MVNLSSFIRYHAARTPDRIAIVYQDQRVTFAGLLARIEKTAGYLAAHGIGPDDVVAVMMKNSIAFLEIAFAVSHLGAIFLPINFRLAADEVEYITENAEAKLVFADAEFALAVKDIPSAILLDETAQADTTAISRNARTGADARAAAGSAVPPDVHFRHHRSAERCDAHLQ